MKKYTLFFSSALLMSILLGYSLAVACPDIEFKNINWSSRRNSNYTPHYMTWNTSQIFMKISRSHLLRR